MFCCCCCWVFFPTLSWSSAGRRCKVPFVFCFCLLLLAAGALLTASTLTEIAIMERAHGTLQRVTIWNVNWPSLFRWWGCWLRHDSCRLVVGSASALNWARYMQRVMNGVLANGDSNVTPPLESWRDVIIWICTCNSIENLTCH